MSYVFGNGTGPGGPSTDRLYNTPGVGDEYSWCVWMKLRSLPTEGFPNLWIVGDTTDLSPHFAVQVDSGTPGRIRLTEFNTNTFSTNQFSASVWYRVSCVRDVGVGTQTQTVRVNNVQWVTLTGNTGLDAPPIVEIMGSGASQGLEALVRRFRVWNTVKTFDDLDAELYSDLAIDSTGLWRDTPLLNDLNDDSGNNRHWSVDGTVTQVNEDPPFAATDDFSTDPAPRWLAIDTTAYTWDSGNSEIDFNTASDDPVMLAYLGGIGALEHECQVTFITGPDSFSARTPVAMVRHRYGQVDGYFLRFNHVEDAVQLLRFAAGVEGEVGGGAALTINAGEWYTVRTAAFGGLGSNVTIHVWVQSHGASKPSDPGWIGADASPTYNWTDTNAARLDDAMHALCGIAGKDTTDYDTRHCFYKQRLIADRPGTLPIFVHHYRQQGIM